jgi:hypothetical protein
MNTPDSTTMPAFVTTPIACDVADLWGAWHDACDDVRHAHAAWRVAGRATSAEAYWVVVAAIDREAAAADLLGRHARPAE